MSPTLLSSQPHNAKDARRTGFDAYVRKAMKDEWVDHYVNYTKVKATIKNYVKRRKALYSLGLLNTDDDDDDDEGDDQLWTEEDYLLLQRHITDVDDGTVVGKDDEEQQGYGGKPTAAAPVSASADYVLVEDDAPATVQSPTTTKTPVATTDATAGAYFRYEDVSASGGEVSATQTRPMKINSRREAREHLSEVERRGICMLLEEEAKKAATFYNSRLAELSRWVHHDLSKASAGGAGDDSIENPKNDDDDAVTFGQVGIELLETFCFVVTNIITIRQCLIRYDAFAKTYDGAPIVYGQWPSKQKMMQQERTSNTLSTSVLGGGNAICGNMTDGGIARNSFTVPNPTAFAATFVHDHEREDNHQATESFLQFILLPASDSHEDEDNNGTPSARSVEMVTYATENSAEDVSNSDVNTTQQDTGLNVTPSKDRTKGIFELGRLRKLQREFLSKLQQRQEFFDSVVIDEYIQEFLNQLENLGQLLDKTSTEIALSDPLAFRDRFIYTLRRYFLVGSKRDGLNLEPKFLLLRGRHLKKEMEDIAKWRRTTALKPQLARLGRRGKGYLPPGSGTVPTHKEADENIEKRGLDPENVLPLILNLVSCFLFMMNNYVIEPSSAYYAEALGSNDALSGIMIGAAPWFALVSAVGYSFWTNSTYKTPIMFSGSLMMIGNLVYSNAYEYTSMEMCLIGRAITGLGAPRVINRRYVADATPFYLRTASSAAFATATALGAALGPGMAIILDMFDFTFKVPGIGEQTFNGMTGPGYFMATCWAIYLALVAVYFKEPTRSGLDELMKREGSAGISGKVDVDAATGDSVNKKRLLERCSTQGTFDEADTIPGDEASLASLNPSSDSKAAFGKNANSPMHCIRHMTQAVAVCMSLLFMKRIALESIVASTSIVTKNRFGWTIKNVGSLHLLNGIIVIPVTIMSGWLSQYRKDRHLALWFISVTILGMLFLVDLTDLSDHDNETYNEDQWLSVGPHKYVTGSLIAFSGIEACESYVASLMSKVVPSALAVGTFNSGLLATLVGTGGRATGDLFITMMGLISIRNLLNLLIIPGISLMIISFVLIRWNYPILAI